VTFRTSDLRGIAEYAEQPREIPMSAHFTVFGGSFVHEARGFSPAPQRRRQALAMWGFVLTSLLFAVTTVASVTASAWAHGAVAY
jgi:hypothetical protein